MTTTRTYHGTLQLVATWLLLGANTVTATILTLSKVETIASVGAPLRCVIAYNTPIVGCNAQELGKDNKCSMQCERALEEVQSNIQRDCQGIAVPRNSLVSQAQQGNLIKVLCDQEPTRQPGSFTRIPDVKTQPAPPPPPPPPATASSEEQTSETTTQRTASSASSTKTEESKTTDEPKQPVTTSIVPSRTSKSKDTETKTSSSSRDAETSVRSSTGGGSPFDPPEPVAAGGRFGLSVAEVIIMCIGVVGIHL